MDHNYKYPIIADNYYDLFGLKPFDTFTNSELKKKYMDRFSYWQRATANPELRDDVVRAKTELIKADKILENNVEKQKYDKRLKNDFLSRLDDFIEASLIDNELYLKKEEQVIEKGKSFGLIEKEIENRINEVLKRHNAQKVNIKSQSSKSSQANTAQGIPELEIIGETSFSFSDVKLGHPVRDSFKVRNVGGGSLEADIIYSAPWLSFNTTKIHQSLLPQTLTFTINASKDKGCKIGTPHSETVIIEYNKGSRKVRDNVNINFTMEDYDLIKLRMQKWTTYLTAGISSLSLFFLFKFNIISLSIWPIIGLIISFIAFSIGFGFVVCDEINGWWGIGAGFLILLISKAQIFFVLFPILLVWFISKHVYSYYPLKKYFIAVIPIFIFLLGYLGYNYLIKSLKLPSFNGLKHASISKSSNHEIIKSGIINTEKGANVRTGPSTSHKRICALQNGKSVRILGENDRWCKVEFELNGKKKIGYIYSQLITHNQK